MNKDILNQLIKCPKCFGALTSSEKSNVCNDCNMIYYTNHHDQPRFIEKDLYNDDEEYEHILSVSKYWDDGWEKRKKEHEYFHNFNAKELHDHAQKKKKELNQSSVGNLLGNEINFKTLNNKIGVNIGSGAGAEASYLMALGDASIIAIDVTAEATRTTQGIINKLGIGQAIQADARYLPIEKNSIDFVYSSGVLHHSRNIRQSINEIYRILKPDGVAYIGLYSKTSIHFQLINLKAILSGSFTKKQINDKLSSNTEPSWRTEGSRNPHTRIFGVSDCRNLFQKFSDVSIRRGGLTLPDRGFYKRIKFLEKSKILSFFGNGLYIKAVK